MAHVGQGGLRQVSRLTAKSRAKHTLSFLSFDWASLEPQSLKNAVDSLLRTFGYNRKRICKEGKGGILVFAIIYMYSYFGTSCI